MKKTKRRVIMEAQQHIQEAPRMPGTEEQIALTLARISSLHIQVQQNREQASEVALISDALGRELLDDMILLLRQIEGFSKL